MRNAVNIFLLLMIISTSVTGQVFFDRYEFTVEQLPLINTEGSEISPAVVNGKMYFSAVREEFIGQERLQEKNMSFYDVYFTRIDENGYPLILRKLVPGFGNMYHEGPVSWCEATGELFVTVSNLAEGKASGKRNNSRNVKLRLVIMKEKDEKWFVTEELPFNQAEYNFAHPAISVTGDTLLFSSDMAGGFGNSDLYMSLRNENGWSEPVNLGETVNTLGNEMFPTFGPDGLLIFSSDGHRNNIGLLDLYYTTFEKNPVVDTLGSQINSQYDDFGMIIHPSGEFGYFASNRPGAGSDDIYRVEFESLYENIRGTVLDNDDMPLPDATVLLQDCNGNELQRAQSDLNGKFSFEVMKNQCYQAVAIKAGYESDLKPYHLGKSVLFNLVQQINYQVYVIDVEDEEPVTDAAIHCDEQQWTTDEYGYAQINTDSLDICDLKISGDNYFDYIIPGDPYRFSPGDNITDTVRLYKQELNKSFKLDNIGYFLDKWRLLPQSEQELGKLVKLMKDNPSLKIELASHTDSRGEAQYNQWLSRKRSDSAKDFLIENGISEDRIVSKGYGESRLLNHCANGVACSEAEHLENRRTEFTILEF